MLPNKHWSFPSLSPWYQHPLWFTNWPILNGLLFFHFFLSTSLLLFLLFSSLPSLSLYACTLPFLFSRRLWKRGRKCVDECVNPAPFLLSFASCFLSLSVFECESKCWAGGPLMYTEKDRGPLLVSSIVTVDWKQLNNPFSERRASSGDGPKIQRGSVSLVSG